MRKTLVYKAEKADGLTEKLSAPRKVSIASVLVPTQPSPLTPSIKAAMGLERSSASVGDEDLFWYKSLLVSTNWNENDDVFTAQEVWQARATPEDKPVNYEHDFADIIGHIVSNEVVDGSMKAIADDTTPDDLPELFHVVTNSVLYKVWPDEKLQTRMDGLIKSIAKGERYVSMEVLFSDFDYCLKSKDEKTRVIARNKDTAFMTKYLRAYGGDGVYKDEKVGRVLKNLIFSGKGIVENPANKASVILDHATASVFFNEISAPQIKTGYSEETRTQESTQMALDEKAFAELQAKYEKLEAAHKELTDKKWESQVATLKAEVEETKKAVLAAQAVATAEKTKTEDALKALEVEKVEKAKAEKSLVETQAKLTEIAVAQKKAERLTLVKATLKVAAGDEKAEKSAVELADTLSDLPDEKFAKAMTAWVDNNAKHGTVPAGPTVAAQEPPKSTNAKDPPKATSVPTGTATAATILDGATPAKEVNLAVADVDEAQNKLQADVAAWFDDEDK